MIVATNFSDIGNPPNAMLGPHGPKPDANVSAKAATPIAKDTTPYLARVFTAFRLTGLSQLGSGRTLLPGGFVHLAGHLHPAQPVHILGDAAVERLGDALAVFAGGEAV